MRIVLLQWYNSIVLFHLSDAVSPASIHLQVKLCAPLLSSIVLIFTTLTYCYDPTIAMVRILRTLLSSSSSESSSVFFVHISKTLPHSTTSLFRYVPLPTSQQHVYRTKSS